MHPNPTYRHASHDENLNFAREIGFGMLAISDVGSNGALNPPFLSHVPFLISPDGKSADLHLMRSNPIARATRTNTPARIAIQGPHSYVSPDWYGADDQVPTWNYVALHMTGTLAPLAGDDLPDLLARISAHYESRLLPKPEWTADKMTDGVMDRMMRMIAPFRFSIADIDGTWKLSQNKPDDVRHNAADHIDTYGIGSDMRLLSAMMRNPPAK